MGVLADADAELEASQRNPDGLGVDDDSPTLTTRVDDERPARRRPAATELAAADTEDDNQSLVDACRDARRALDESVAALDAAVRVARDGQGRRGRDAAAPGAEPAKAAASRRMRRPSQDNSGVASMSDRATQVARWRPRRRARRRAARARGASAMAERRTAAAAAALEQCLDAFDDLGRWTTARAPPPSPKPTPRMRTPPRPPRAEAASSARRRSTSPSPREPKSRRSNQKRRRRTNLMTTGRTTTGPTAC